MMRKIHNLVFILSIKIVRRVQSHATFKSIDTLEQGAMAMHFFILGHLLFTVTYPFMEFVFKMSGSQIKLAFAGILFSEYIYTYFILLRAKKWEKIEHRIDNSMAKTLRDRYFGLFSLFYIIYYSITIIAFMLINCTYSPS